MSAIDVIKRRLKEERVPDAPSPDEVSEKKKRPREVAFMDVNLCFPCGKCPEFCPVQCIEYLAPGSVPGRGVQPVQDRYQECIGCYICVEVCALLTDYDAVRMYDVDLVEQVLGTKIGDTKPAEYQPAEPWEELFSEGGLYRHLGKGSRIREWWSHARRAPSVRRPIRGPAARDAWRWPPGYESTGSSSRLRSRRQPVRHRDPALAGEGLAPSARPSSEGPLCASLCAWSSAA